MPRPAPPAVAVPLHQAAAPPAPLIGPLAPNDALLHAAQLFEGVAKPETPLVLPDGTAYVASSESGQLLKLSVADPSRVKHVAWLTAPAGMVMHPDGYLVVCDMVKGLLSVHPETGAVGLLASRLSNASLAPGEAAVMFCDDVDVGPRSGKVYFSDSTRIPPLLDATGLYDPLGASILTALQGGATGRLLVYDPHTRATQLLADGIRFSNGVALAEDESFALVVDTYGRRVHRVWLEGPRAGDKEVFVDGLPGFPDGVSRAPGGSSFWVAIASPVTPLHDLAMRASRLLRWLLAWLPPLLAPARSGLVLEVSADGRILRSLHDPAGANCHTITSAVQVGSTLYMGTLGASHVCALDLGQAAEGPVAAAPPAAAHEGVGEAAGEGAAQGEPQK